MRLPTELVIDRWRAEAEAGNKLAGTYIRLIEAAAAGGEALEPMVRTLAAGLASTYIDVTRLIDVTTDTLEEELQLDPRLEDLDDDPVGEHPAIDPVAFLGTMGGIPLYADPTVGAEGGRPQEDPDAP